MSKIKYAICFVVCFVALNGKLFSQGTGNHVTMSLQNCSQIDPSTIQADLMVMSDGVSTSDLRMSALSYGINFDTLILKPGATMSGQVVSGTTDSIFYQTFVFSNLTSTVKGHVKFSSNACIGCNIFGTVDVNGTSVTWASGSGFPTTPPLSYWINHPIRINGVIYLIASINSATSLTLQTPAPPQTGANYAINSMVVGRQYRVSTVRLVSSAPFVGNKSPSLLLHPGGGIGTTPTATQPYIGNAGSVVNFSVTGTGNGQRSLSVTCSLTLNPCDITTTTSFTPACFGSNNGTAKVIPNSANNDACGGCFDPYSYLWNNGATDTVAVGLTAGTYTVTVTNDANCTAVATVTVTQPPTALAASCGGTHVTCNGASTGTASVTASSGNPPYSYLWNTGSTATSTAISGLSAGTYTVTVTDINNCKAICSFTITQPAAFSVTCAKTDLTCNGGSNGTATANIAGGTAPYIYLWNTGANTSSITGLTQGTYSVTVTDNCSVVRNCSATVNNPPALSANCGGTSLACAGGNTGSASVTASGGTPPYSYLWSNGQTTSTITSLSGATYTVTVSDFCNLSFPTCSYLVTSPPAVAAACNGTHVACNGGTNGTAAVTASGGTPGYTYLWSFNNRTTTSITGLSAGTYCVTVTDNCASPGTATCCFTVTQPPALSAACSGTNILCNGANTGSASVTASGGTAPYTYLWSNGLTTTNNGTLTAGTYTVTVTDSHACTATCSYAVTQPSAITVTAGVTPNPVCAGPANSVTFSSTASGGTGTKTFAWTGPNSFSSTLQNPSITNMTAVKGGTYTVTVTDANACTAKATIALTVSVCNHLTMSLKNCTTLAPNVIQFDLTVVSDGSPLSDLGANAFQYGINFNSGILQPGDTVIPSYVPNSSHFLNPPNPLGVLNPFTIIPPTIPGIIRITESPYSGGNDLNMHLAVGTTYTVGTFKLTSNLPFRGNTSPNFTLQDTSEAGKTPTVMIGYIKNATSSTVFSLSGPGDGDTIPSNAHHRDLSVTCALTLNPCTQLVVNTSSTPATCFGGNTGSASVTASGGTGTYTYLWSNGRTTTNNGTLTAGTYGITVTDNLGCQGFSSATVTQPSAITASASLVGPIACNGGSTTVSVIASGGTSPYTGTGSFTNSTGTYTFIVTDAQGCTGSTTITITQPTAITASANSGTIACNGGSTNVTVTASGGIGPYTGTGFFSRSAGPYTFIVTDANGCTGSTTISVTEPTALTASSSSGNIACFGGNTTITVTASGGTPGYTGMGNFTRAAGLYTFVVTDSRGCTASTIITVTQPAAVTASSSAGTIACNGGSTTVTVTATGGTSNYAGTGNFTRTAGPYTFIVTDANGCTGSTTITITQPAALSMGTCTHTNVSCNGGSNATATAGTVANAQGTVNYLWSANANSQTTAIATGLSAGTYTVTVSDNCSSVTCSQTVTQPTAVTASSTSGNVACNGGSTTVTVTASGGTPTYSGTGTFTRSAGSYTFIVTDFNGCTASTSITVTEPTVLSASSSSGNIACFGGSTTVTVTGSGGTPAYTGTGNFVRTAGSYTFIITDSRGCTATTTITLTQPTAVTASSSAGSILCNGGSTTVTVTATGGTAGYTGTGTFTRSAGPYTFIVTDANGCTGSTTGTVTQPTAITASSVKGTINCNGGTTTVTVSASGGTPPYNGTGIFTQGAGNYTFIVTDANNCTATTTGTITQPTAITATCNGTNATCNGGTNGSASIAASGGTPAYSYSWSNGATTTSISGLPAGTYCVTVTDSKGCTNSCCYTVTEPAIPAVTASSNSPISQGSTLNLSSTGGFVTYNWAGPNGFTSTAQNPSISNATVNASGTYTVTVTNASGCTASATTTVTVSSGGISIMSLKLYLSGFYRPSFPEPNKMVANLFDCAGIGTGTTTDSITVNIWCDTCLSMSAHPNPDTTLKVILHTDGTTDPVTLSNRFIGNSYYIAVKHRNHLETWSKLVSFSAAFTFDFTNPMTQALNNGFNPPMKQLTPVRFGLWGGDPEQNGDVGVGDMAIIDIDASNFAFGYNASDCDGDCQTGAGDMSIVDNNTQLFLFTNSPRTP